MRLRFSRLGGRGGLPRHGFGLTLREPFSCSVCPVSIFIILRKASEELDPEGGGTFRHCCRLVFPYQRVPGQCKTLLAVLTQTCPAPPPGLGVAREFVDETDRLYRPWEMLCATYRARVRAARRLVWAAPVRRSNPRPAASPRRSGNPGDRAPESVGNGKTYSI
jgi:hypothetical protein